MKKLTLLVGLFAITYADSSLYTQVQTKAEKVQKCATCKIYEMKEARYKLLHKDDILKDDNYRSATDKANKMRVKQFCKCKE